MGSVREQLQERFVSLKYLQLVPVDERLAFYDTLAARYEEPHRHYHVLDHIGHCFSVFDAFRHLAHNPNALEVAIFYHDIVYDIGVPARQNEERSALYLVSCMMAWNLYRHDFYDSMSAVLATTHDHTPSTNDNKLIVDIDLAGLGAPWPIFLQNNMKVREEYKHIPEDKFREGNGKILQRFLERTPLYFFPEIEEVYGAQAKENLNRWLNRP
jgi:predicted metal-dependent HD superfamily phosphohydrolase